MATRILNGETVLDSGRNKFGRELKLVHRRQGMYPAGSISVERSEGWAVLWDVDGTRNGQWYKTLDEAQQGFKDRNVV